MTRRNGKMTKNTLIAVAVIVVILSLGMYYWSSSLNANNSQLQVDLNNLMARKEELVSTQEQIQATLKELNNALELESTKQQQLQLEISQMAGKSGSSVENNPVVNVPAVNTPNPQPTPTPRPVTRAS